jgi:hypothetical protein
MRNVLLFLILAVIVLIAYVATKKEAIGSSDSQPIKIPHPITSNDAIHLAVFNHPRANFTFSYPSSLGSTGRVVEVENEKNYELHISGEDTIKIRIATKELGFVRVATNPNQIEYRKFIGDDKLAHIIFYGYGDDGEIIELVLDVADQMAYSDTVIQSFKFTMQ